MARRGPRPARPAAEAAGCAPPPVCSLELLLLFAAVLAFSYMAYRNAQR